MLLPALGAGRNRVTPLPCLAGLDRLGASGTGWGRLTQQKLLMAQHRAEVPPSVPFLWQVVISRRSFPFIVITWVTMEGKKYQFKLEKS